MESNKKIVRSQEEQISRAEILHLLRLIKHDQFFASCEDLIKVLAQALLQSGTTKLMETRKEQENLKAL